MGRHIRRPAGAALNGTAAHHTSPVAVPAAPPAAPPAPPVTLPALPSLPAPTYVADLADTVRRLRTGVVVASLGGLVSLGLNVVQLFVLWAVTS
jgi:hypothetical protein